MSKPFVNVFYVKDQCSISMCLFRKVISAEVRPDTESYTNYVRVLDPHAQEISFVRTDCRKREALYVACDNLGI